MIGQRAPLRARLTALRWGALIIVSGVSGSRRTRGQRCGWRAPRDGPLFSRRIVHSFRAFRPAVVATAFALLAVAACSDSPTKGGNNGTPAAIAISAGNNQVGMPGTPLAAPIAARVTNAQGNPVSGKAVDFTVTRGGGTVASAIGDHRQQRRRADVVDARQWQRQAAGEGDGRLARADGHGDGGYDAVAVPAGGAGHRQRRRHHLDQRHRRHHGAERRGAGRGAGIDHQQHSFRGAAGLADLHAR